MYSERSGGFNSRRPGSGSGGRQPGFGGRQGRDNFFSAPHQGITRTVDLPADKMAGIIIGKGGETIKKLQKMDGVLRVNVHSKVVTVQAIDEVKANRCVNEIMLLIAKFSDRRLEVTINVLDARSRRVSQLRFRLYDKTIDRHSYEASDTHSAPYMLTCDKSDGNDAVSDLAARLEQQMTIRDGPPSLTSQDLTFLRAQHIEPPGASATDAIRTGLCSALKKLTTLVGTPPMTKCLVPMHAALQQKNALAVEMTCRSGNFTFFGKDSTTPLHMTGTHRSNHRMIFSPKFQPTRLCAPTWITSQWDILETEAYTTCHVTDCATGYKLHVRLAVDHDDPLKPVDISDETRLSPDKKAAIARLQKATTLYEVLDLDAASLQQITDAMVKKTYRKASMLLHPDKNCFPEATDAFKCLRNAYEVLENAQGRRDYARNPTRFPVLPIASSAGGVAGSAPAHLPLVVRVISEKQRLFSMSTVRVAPGDVGVRWVMVAGALDDSNDAPENAASRARILRALEEAWGKQDASGLIACPSSDTKVYAECMKQVKAESWTDGNWVFTLKHVKERRGMGSCVNSEKYVEADLWSYDMYDKCMEFVAGTLDHDEFTTILGEHIEECKAMIDKLFN